MTHLLVYLIGSISFARVVTRVVALEQDIDARELRVARRRGEDVVDNPTLPRLIPRLAARLRRTD